ncbi:MAG: curli assembly protein CsgF [Rickettsiales bacterium]|nr:curli assembly protein CsgF [Rickettsiales bacterium]
MEVIGMRGSLLHWIVAFALSYSIPDSYASELRYTPVNPNFGGDPFNSTILLGVADATNDNTEPFSTGDSLADFERTITNTLISRVSQEIADQILGEDAQDSGTFSVGGTILDFNNNNGVVTINITDTSTGGTTTVEIPSPTF